MTATKGDVIARLQATRDEITELVESIQGEAWAKPSYQGWTCQQLLSHIASTSGPASFILAMSRLPAQPGAGGGGGFDQDAFNAQQVALRAGRWPNDVLGEIRANLQRDIQAIEAAPDADLQKHYEASWGTKGTVADVIISSLEGHLGMHIADLRARAAA